MLRTVRYARGWNAGAEVRIEETEVVRDGVALPATFVLPAHSRGPLPGWIVIGGVTRMGRFHPQLVRFANALAASGAAVLVPEIPEWRELRVSPGVTAPTIRACVTLLKGRREVRVGKFGLIGFSFGGPQVAISAGLEELAGQVAGVVLFGAYCCLERTVRCQLTGGHEWEGVDYALNPDPYGRWVLAGNYLTDIPGCEDAGDVARSLHRLAAAASDKRVPAWDPFHDEMIAQLRLALPNRRKGLFDYFATPSTGARPERGACVEMAKRLTSACRRVEPLLEPAPHLAQVDLPTLLIHGRGDRLIPFTEAMRLMRGLPEACRRGLTVTRLFDHSAGRSPVSLTDRVREGMTFFGTIRGLINTV